MSVQCVGNHNGIPGSFFHTDDDNGEDVRYIKEHAVLPTYPHGVGPVADLILSARFRRGYSIFAPKGWNYHQLRLERL